MHFKKVVFRVVPQDTTAAQLLRSGQVSFVEQISPSLWKSFQGQAGIRTLSVPSFQNLLGQLNAKTLSLPVRQAISYGINYAGIVAALQGAAVQPSGLVPAGLPGHYTNLPNYHYDPAKAVQLLHQAGYGPGKKALNLSLTYTQGDSNEQVVATPAQVEPGQAEHQPVRPVAGLADAVGQGEVGRRGQPPEHLPRVLVAGLRRPVHLVQQPAADREAAVLQSLLLLQLDPGQADQPGGDAARDQPDRR